MPKKMKSATVLCFVAAIIAAALKWFGSFYVFLITSICSAIFDLIFVVISMETQF